jgi:hypothetical protein
MSGGPWIVAGILAFVAGLLATIAGDIGSAMVCYVLGFMAYARAHEVSP